MVRPHHRPRTAHGPATGRHRLRIAMVAPPFQPVPPRLYGGVERIVDTLARGLAARGHDVVLYASGDSTCPVPLEPTVERALWPEDLRLGRHGDEDADAGAVNATAWRVVADAAGFDVVHVHLDGPGLELLRPIASKVVATVHLPVDDAERRHRYGSLGVAGLVALSESQLRDAPGLPWLGIVPNGIEFPGPADAPDADAHSTETARDALCFVGRLDPAKGPLEAIEIARLSSRRLRIAAKAGGLSSQRDFVRDRFLPALRSADVEYLGELESGARDRLISGSLATLMPVTWPEPFGLVAVESLVLGTPVLAHPLGALPEIVRDGRDGFLAATPAELAARVDDVARLDRDAIRVAARERFGSERMVAGYEAIYRRIVAASGPGRSSPATPATRAGAAPREDPRNAAPPGGLTRSGPRRMRP